MKNGIYKENDELIYYRNDLPYHAGVVEIDGYIYYIGRHGRVATGYHIVHGEMSNGLLERGTYKFGEDGKLIEGSYIAPKKHKKHHKKRKSKSKHKKQLIYIGLPAFFVAILLVIAILFQTIGIPKPNKSSYNESKVEIVMPTFEEPVLLCSEMADGLYHNKYTMADMAGTVPYRPFEFQYRLNGANGLLKLSEQTDMTNSTEYVLSAAERKIYIDNLKTNTTYYYLIDVDDETYTGSFQTAEGTRYITIPGVYNTRDIGGYKTSDGKTVKQGKIIRGTEIDGLVEEEYFLPTEYIDDVVDEFGFVYDMDLREETTYSGEYSSRFGESVGHKFYTSPQYGFIFNEHFKIPLKQIFSDLAKPNNYPMYLHCTYGLDRTGTIVYLLQGLLNMPKEDMVREFQMSGFCFPEHSSSTNMDSIDAGLEKYSGDTVNEKIESFLTEEIGVTKEEIDSIRNILLEE